MTQNTDPFLSSHIELNDSDQLIYVVYKQGKFGQGIHGIDGDREKAIAMADKAAARDIDDYHSYDVYPVPLGRLPDAGNNPMEDYGWMNMEPVHSVMRSKVSN